MFSVSPTHPLPLSSFQPLTMQLPMVFHENLLLSQAAPHSSAPLQHFSLPILASIYPVLLLVYISAAIHNTVLRHQWAPTLKGIISTSVSGRQARGPSCEFLLIRVALSLNQLQTALCKLPQCCSQVGTCINSISALQTKMNAKCTLASRDFVRTALVDGCEEAKGARARQQTSMMPHRATCASRGCQTPASSY